MKRRELLQYSALGTITAALPGLTFAETEEATRGLLNSDLVYLSPVRSDGSLSSCQAEIWFAVLGTSVFVCTRTTSWRVQAVKQGLTTTHFWVGDRGIWRRNNYQSLPTMRMEGAVETGDESLEAALQAFGNKYAGEWGKWGPRFRNGLADGSRTMLRYAIT